MLPCGYAACATQVDFIEWLVESITTYRMLRGNNHRNMVYLTEYFSRGKVHCISTTKIHFNKIRVEQFFLTRIVHLSPAQLVVLPLERRIVRECIPLTSHEISQFPPLVSIDAHTTGSLSIDTNELLLKLKHCNNKSSR
jgi:hypothetical protein